MGGARGGAGWAGPRLQPLLLPTRFPLQPVHDFQTCSLLEIQVCLLFMKVIVLAGLLVCGSKVAPLQHFLFLFPI